MLNGSTHYDVTNYYESVPSNALERVLWLEADRMRALKVDDENLRNQRDVVKEEVRVNVLNQPYGGFPWLDLPPVAFRNWPNAHNFYGDFADLDAATLDDVQQFFRTYYAPSNAVLLMLGDVTPPKRSRWRSRHFEDIPAAAPPPADVTEAPHRGAPREVEEKFGTLPGIAIGYTLRSAAPRLVRGWHAGSRPARRPRRPRLSQAGARAADRRGHRRQADFLTTTAQPCWSRASPQARNSPRDHAGYDEVIRRNAAEGNCARNSIR